jgi:hypothetical protein
VCHPVKESRVITPSVFFLVANHTLQPTRSRCDQSISHPIIHLPCTIRNVQTRNALSRLYISSRASIPPNNKLRTLSPSVFPNETHGRQINILSSFGSMRSGSNVKRSEESSAGPLRPTSNPSLFHTVLSFLSDRTPRHVSFILSVSLYLSALLWLVSFPPPPPPLVDRFVICFSLSLVWPSSLNESCMGIGRVVCL